MVEGERRPRMETTVTASTAPLKASLTEQKASLATQQGVMDLVELYLSALDAAVASRGQADLARFLAEHQDSTPEFVASMTAYYENPSYTFSVAPGKKFLKIVQTSMGLDDKTKKPVAGQVSVHSFVDKMTGEVYKAAGWAAPAKGVRYNLADDASREAMFERVDPFGSYLYAR